jgi:hypothetical protein
VLVTSTVGGVVATVNGKSFASGFTATFKQAALTYGNYLMRMSAFENSSLNPDGSNIDGESEGMFGIKAKLAGARRELGAACVSLMGGCQGAPRLPGDVRSSFFGMEYAPGSIPDRINESFAGPHDYFRNLTGSYDELGNSRTFTGMRLTVDKIMNYALVLPAAPFALAALVPVQYYRDVRPRT